MKAAPSQFVDRIEPLENAEQFNIQMGIGNVIQLLEN